MDSKKQLAAIRWEALSRRIGSRYVNCTLDNFQCQTASQREAIDGIHGFIEKMPANIREGAGVFLYGPVGTGKDHLLVAMMREVVRRGMSVRWFNGLDFFGRIRDLIDSKSSESGFIEQMQAPDVLALSDPFAGRETLTQHQTDVLTRIVDARYRDKRATWVTANVRSREDAEKRLGVPMVDRLGHGCLSIHCNWPSYRRAEA